MGRKGDNKMTTADFYPLALQGADMQIWQVPGVQAY